ncbi:hypothetical protein FB451DRAFT_1407954 [Mycena latifolia]|nr:hypothetical protein FB451DRAFT_1407954 [Mycena latifolia]
MPSPAAIAIAAASGDYWLMLRLIPVDTMYTLCWYFSSQNFQGAKAKDLAQLLMPLKSILHDHQIVRANYPGPEPPLGIAFLAGVARIFRAVPAHEDRKLRDFAIPPLAPTPTADAEPDDTEAPRAESPRAESPPAEAPCASPGAASYASFDSEPWERGDTPTHPLIDDEAEEASAGHNSEAVGSDSDEEAPRANSLKRRRVSSSSSDSDSSVEQEVSGANSPPPAPPPVPSRAKSPSVPFSDIVISHAPEGTEGAIRIQPSRQDKSSGPPPAKRARVEGAKVEYKRPTRVAPQNVHDDEPFSQYGRSEDKKAKDFGLRQDAIHFVPPRYLRETATYVQARAVRRVDDFMKDPIAALAPCIQCAASLISCAPRGLGFSCERCGNGQREKCSHQIPSAVRSTISTNIANGLPLPLQTALAMDKELEHAATLLQGAVHHANEAGCQYTYAIRRALHHALLTCANTSRNDAARQNSNFDKEYERLTRYASCLAVSLDKTPLVSDEFHIDFERFDFSPSFEEVAPELQGPFPANLQSFKAVHVKNEDFDNLFQFKPEPEDNVASTSGANSLSKPTRESSPIFVPSRSPTPRAKKPKKKALVKQEEGAKLSRRSSATSKSKDKGKGKSKGTRKPPFECETARANGAVGDFIRWGANSSVFAELFYLNGLVELEPIVFHKASSTSGFPKGWVREERRHLNSISDLSYLYTLREHYVSLRRRFMTRLVEDRIFALRNLPFHRPEFAISSVSTGSFLIR